MVTLCPRELILIDNKCSLSISQQATTHECYQAICRKPLGHATHDDDDDTASLLCHNGIALLINLHAWLLT